MQPALLILSLTLTLTAPVAPAFGQAKKPAARVRPTMTITVTNLEGKTLPDVWVKATGPVSREAATDENGIVAFQNMTAGTYRLRFEHDEFVTLERDVTQAARALAITVSLNAAPPRPEPPPPPPPPAAALPPAGPPTFVSVPDFFEKNYLGSAPSMTSLVGCVPAMTIQLLQLRDPLGDHSHKEADEVIYVVGGEGTHRIAGQEIPLSAGVLATVPRGTAHSITRRGRNPIVVLSFTTEPCTGK